MLEELGVDGMSSDESDTEDGDIQYHILSPQWRSRLVSGWLRMFDTIHRLFRRNGSAAASRGNYPCNRKTTHRKSNSIKFVAGLPVNAYNEEWIANNPMRKYDLRSRESYEFIHNEDLIESEISIPDS